MAKHNKDGKPRAAPSPAQVAHRQKFADEQKAKSAAKKAAPVVAVAAVAVVEPEVPKETLWRRLWFGDWLG